jgi:hypothetical protein
MGSGGCLVILGRWLWVIAAMALVLVGVLLLVAEPIARRAARAAEADL